MTIDQPAAGAYPIATREQVLDSMAGYPGYGEQRWYTAALRAEHVSFSWRRMPAGTGGRGSYGHRHPGQEEVYFVISGTHVQDRRRRLRSWPADRDPDRWRGLPLRPQRRRHGGRAADLLAPARGTAAREARSVLAPIYSVSAQPLDIADNGAGVARRPAFATAVLQLARRLPPDLPPLEPEPPPDEQPEPEEPLEPVPPPEQEPEPA